MQRLTGKRTYSDADVLTALQAAYAAYYTQSAANADCGKKRVKADVDLFLKTGELPGYALSAAS